MDHTYEIVLQVQDNAGDLIRKELIEEVAREIASHFGGVTVVPVAAGCYTTKAGTLHCDQDVIFYAARINGTYSDLVDDEAWVHQFAERLGREFGQESVFESENTATHTRLADGHYRDSLPSDMLSGGRAPADVLADLIPGR